MKYVQNADRLQRRLQALKGTARKHATAAIRRGTEEGVRVAKILAPEDTGRTKREIKSSYSADGMTGVVVAIDRDAPQSEKDRAYSIEYGRKKGNRGTTQGALFMRTTRQYLAKKNRGRIRRAINKAAKEAAGRG